MLAPGRYPQWRSRFLRYVDTRPNGKALRKCILSGPYKPSTVLVHAVEATDNSPAVAEHTTLETPANMSTFNFFNNFSRNGQGKEIAKPITPPSKTAFEEDNDPEQAQMDKDMQKNLALIAKYFKKIYKPTNNNLRTSSNSKNKNVDTTPRYKNDDHSGQFGTQRTVNVARTREKVGSQYDWLADTDEEVDEQEMEAHYSYMAKIQEVPNAYSGTDFEPVEQVQNDTGYNVFANALQHSEQSESNDQNDVESNDEHVALANLIANLKLDVDENKKFQKQLKKANTTLAQELKECKDILAETSQSLGESISVRDSCLVALQNKQTEFEKYKAFNDRIVDYDKLEFLVHQLLHPCPLTNHTAWFAMEHLAQLVYTATSSPYDMRSPSPFLLFISKSRQAYNAMTNNINHFKRICDDAWTKHSKDRFRAPTALDMELLIQTCLMPLAIKTESDSLKFVHELKQEMHTDLKYVESLEKEIDELESEKAEFSDMFDVILQECVSKDVMCSYLQTLSDLDALAKLQCMYLHKVKECDFLAQKLSNQTEYVSKEVHSELLKRFAKVEKHSISLEIDLQKRKEQVKNDKVWNEKASNVFRKEREQYIKIQDLKAKLQDKNIAIILGKPAPFSDSLERKYFPKKRSVSKANVSEGLSKTVIAQTSPQTARKAVSSTNVLKLGMYRIDNRTAHTKAPQLTQTVRNTNPCVSTSTGVNHKPNVSRPHLKSNKSRDKVLQNNSQVKVKKTQVEVHPRISSVSNKIKYVTACNDSLKSRTLNATAVCATCNKCLVDSNHFACVTKLLNDVHARTKKPNFAPILGYGDLVQGNVTINRVYYVEGLNHNLFSVGQFCDADLEVAFRKSTCFVRDLQGNDLLATPTQAWLWHRRLSYLNFDYINLLSKKDIVIGLPKLKYVKDQLCSSCELSKAKRSSFKSKVVPSSKGRLNLLHMDLCVPMRVASINEKKYILVIVDDYSRYTWTLFLRSKDETPEVGTEFLNKTLTAFFKKESIEHQTSTARTPKQNGVVERQNHADVPSQQELDLLFGPLYDEFFNAGLQIHQSPHGIFINQAKYTLEILHKHGMDKGQSISTPMATKPKLDADLSGNPIDQTNYHSKIGSLMYLTSTRPDIVQANCTAMSSAEAEYVALSVSCAQVMWMRTQLQDYSFNYNKLPTEYQLADMFTKALPEDRFKYLVRRIGMRCLTPAELEVLAKESA
nr:hypothetical protein [Tanacetum cinerariifolium]